MPLIPELKIFATLLGAACAQSPDLLSSLVGGASSRPASVQQSLVITVALLNTAPTADLSLRLASLSSVVASAGASGAASIASVEAGIRSSASAAPVTSTAGLRRSISTLITSTGTESSVRSFSTGSADSEQHDNSLSTGAKAGIGVTIPLVVLIFVGLAFVLWRRKRSNSISAQTPPFGEHNTPTAAHSGLMVQSYDDNHDTSKPELDGTSVAEAPPPPMNAHHRTPDMYVHELPTSARSPPVQPLELSNTQDIQTDSNQHTPADVGPAIVVPTPYREEENRLEQLRVQRAAIARDRERKEEIDRMRAEEERLDRAIAELEGRQY
jgi:hypothetical protein